MIATIKDRLNRVLSLATRHRRLTVCLHTVSVAAASILLLLYVRAIESERVRLEFETQTGVVANRLTENLDVYHEVVRSISSFYAASEDVTRDDFNAFVRRPLNQHSGVLALEWIPRVSADAREDFERAVQADGLTDFQFKRWTSDNTWVASSSQWADSYFPVYYVQPYSGNEPVPGIDLASNPVRRRSMQAATDTGHAVATSGITLVQESKSQTGFLLFVPVYKRGTRTDTITQRRQNLSGFALGVFRVKDIVEGVFDRNSMDAVSLTVTDDTGTVIYSCTDPIAENDALSAAYHHSVDCAVGGRSWQLQFASCPEWVVAHRSLAEVPIVIGGTLLALLTGIVLHTVTGRAESIARVVRERTAELKSANQVISLHSEKLSLAKDVLEQSNQQLKEFACAASHDLQTPLRGIATFAGFLKEEYSDQLDQTANGYIGRIIGSADRMRQLIQDLLEYSRVESQSRNLAPTNLNDIFDDVLALLETEIEDADGTVTRDDLPSIDSDPQQMSQLFRNLISNSLKYRGDAPVRIHVSARCEDMWSISVADNGIGIDSSFHSQIFDIFRRLHTQSEYPGTGIGLALCRRIVQRHGGHIRVESEPGQGSTFTFTLPGSSVQNEPAGPETFLRIARVAHRDAAAKELTS